MRVVVAGGRDQFLSQKDKAYLLSLVEDKTITELVCGMAEGIDIDSYKLLKPVIPVKEFPADWSNLDAVPCIVKRNKLGFLYNVLAGTNRNKAMAEYAEGVILFPGGTGTDNMYKQAKENNLKIIGDFREILY